MGSSMGSLSGYARDVMQLKDRGWVDEDDLFEVCGRCIHNVRRVVAELQRADMIQRDESRRCWVFKSTTVIDN